MTQSALPMIWGETNKGIQRGHNEDQIYPDSRHKTSLRPPTPQALAARGSLLIVADGIGGAQVGDTAANFAVRTVVDHYYGDPRPLSLDRLLQAAVEMANTSVFSYVSNSPAIQQAGCTMTAAVVHGAELVVAHVGDSRAYLLRKATLSRLTMDHNVAQMLASGQTPPGGQPLAGNVLTRSLGAGPVVAVDVNRYPLEPGDTVLVCSDGLHGVLSDDEIKKVLGRMTPEKAAGKLIDLANAQGGPDNISVVIARLPDAAPAAAIAGTTSGSNRTPLYVVAGMMALAVLVLLAFMVNGLNRNRNTPPPLAATTAAITSATSIAPVAAPLATMEATLEPTNSPTMAGIVASSPSPTLSAPTASVGFASVEPSTVGTLRRPTSTPQVPTPTPIPTRSILPSRLATPIRSSPLFPTQPLPTTGRVLLPPPIPTSPEKGDTRVEVIDFAWEYNTNLKPGEAFLVQLRTDQLQNRQVLDLQTRSKYVQIRFAGSEEYREFFGIPGTRYYWRVTVVSGGQLISTASEERDFYYQIESGDQEPPPPTDTPEPPTGTPEPPTATSEPTDTPEPPTKTPPPTSRTTQ